MKKKNGQTVSIWMDQNLLADVDRLAEKAGLTRSKMISNMVEVATNSLTKADSVGIVSIAILLRDFEEGIRCWIQGMREEQEDKISDLR